MANVRDIRNKIASVKNTQKITKAMQMVSASKMRKAQERMHHCRPYASKILQVIEHITHAHPEYNHPYLIEREVKRVGFIVITTDRGLCGALNNNILRETLKAVDTFVQKGIQIDLCLVGNKADKFFRGYKNCTIVAKDQHVDENTAVADILGIITTMLVGYQEQKIDALYLCYNKFVNTMNQKNIVQKLLPITSGTKEKHYWDYIYEPDAKDLLNRLLKRFVEVQVYQGVVENFASEQSARMMAMMNATDNAQNLIKDLQLSYNKIRQAGITREISEIVNGAEAING